MTVDVRGNIALFDGQRAHEVLPFSGERYSIVWFSCARYWEANRAGVRKLTKLGFQIPTEKSIATVSAALRRPRGPGAKWAEGGRALPGALQWPSDLSGCRFSGKKRGREGSASA